MKIKKNYAHLIGCLCTSIRKSSRNISRVYNEILKQSGEKITANQLSILVLLSEIKTASITDLSDQLKTERTTMTRNLNVLEKSKWIKIYGGNDGRMKYIKINTKGIKIIKKIVPHWKKAENVSKKLIGEDIEIFRKTLKKINQYNHT